MRRQVIASLALGQFLFASASAAEPGFDSPQAEASEQTDVWTGRTVLTKSADVVLHEEPDEKAPVVALSHVGVWLHVKKTKNGWLNVEFGWIPAENVVRDDQAVEYFTSELRQSESESAYVSRSRAWLNANEIDKADADVSEAFRLEPRSGRAYFARAKIAAARQQADEELAAYDRALEIDPRDPIVLKARAKAWAGRGEYDRAIADLDVALDALPTSSHLFACRGYCRAKTDDNDKAFADFTRALELDPNDAYSLAVRAGMYFGKQEFANALRDADRAMPRVFQVLVVVWANEPVPTVSVSASERLS
jgi:Tfp pilus assembly protein PilF